MRRTNPKRSFKRDLYVFNFNVVESVIDQYVLTLIHKIIDTHSDNPNTVPDFVRVIKILFFFPCFLYSLHYVQLMVSASTNSTMQ